MTLNCAKSPTHENKTVSIDHNVSYFDFVRFSGEEMKTVDWSEELFYQQRRVGNGSPPMLLSDRASSTR